MKQRQANTTIPLRKYDKFLDSLSSSYTKEQYAYHLKRFTKYIKKDPLLLKKSDLKDRRIYCRHETTIFITRIPHPGT